MINFYIIKHIIITKKIDLKYKSFLLTLVKSSKEKTQNFPAVMSTGFLARYVKNRINFDSLHGNLYHLQLNAARAISVFYIYKKMYCTF